MGHKVSEFGCKLHKLNGAISCWNGLVGVLLNMVGQELWWTLPVCHYSYNKSKFLLECEIKQDMSAGGLCQSVITVNSEIFARVYFRGTYVLFFAKLRICQVLRK